MITIRLLRMLIPVFMVLLLLSCATQKTITDKAEDVSREPVIQPSIEPRTPEEPIGTPAEAPKRIIYKEGQKLMLVRAMEGGACNSNDQGARGIFLIYANPEDIKDIEKEKPEGTFKNFESEIQEFSLTAFQQAVKQSNISVNPFALDQNDAINSVTRELVANFYRAIENDVTEFGQNNNLGIQVVPFESSFDLYSEDCASNLTDTEPRQI